MNYQHAKTEFALARARREHASCVLDLAGIKMRLAELADQHEPLETKSEGDRVTRGRMYSAAFYAVIGRWPGEPKKTEKP